ncbi:PREDICTED: vomeronasal type-1 receptor 2-like [Elephantulus edwardii]|uniref:vomeronasal type-1 receptor 2-like n=1 Tax=Elephantulus edwardii TaxID=28737 RepID=UPI0003F092FF|nr:PREDICTED: vomeronasal type-1 receptor 2-like [Elephantulus edwardii]
MDLKPAVFLLVQILIGLLGNFSLIIHYTFLHFCGGNSRSTDLILRHLVLANTLAILSKGVPRTMQTFGVAHHFSDVGCKLLFYFERVSRGVSIGTTCLLSVFQAITISPLHSRWAVLKLKALKYIGPSNILCWILHMLVNAVFPIYTSSKWNNSTIVSRNGLQYCSKHDDSVTFSLYMTLIFSHDVLCLGFMSWASGSMVFVLCKHKQQVQHIYNNLSPRFFAETRATKIILPLVAFYVSFYALSSFMSTFLAHLGLSSWWLVNTSAFMSMCFPTVSPFVLMSTDSRVSRLCATCFKITT